jgi:hypothetical protein
VTSKEDPNVVAPETDNVDARRVAPVTSKEDPNVVAPETERVEAIRVAPELLTEKLDPDTLRDLHEILPVDACMITVFEPISTVFRK